MAYLKKIRLFFLGVMFLTFFSACSTPEGDSAKLYETAQFEEQQFNTKHAKQLYEEILQKYPDSSIASKARKRLEALEAESP